MSRVALLLSALFLTASLSRVEAQHTRTERYLAVVVVDHLWRDGGVYIHDTCNVEVALQLRGATAEMRVTGHMERHAAELSPSGPSDAQHDRAEVDHVWTGTHQRDALHRLIDFTQTTETAPASDPNVGLDCSPEEVDLAGQIAGRSERVLRCNVTPTPHWTTHPTTYLIAPIRFSRDREGALRNEVWLSDFGNERITLTRAERRPEPARSRAPRR